MSDAAVSLSRCECCGRLYEAKRFGARYCSDPCRHSRPEIVARKREVCRQWAAVHRGCVTRRPWLAGAPPYPGHLPGGCFGLDVEPAPQWPIVHRNVRALHGMLTTLIGKPHHPRLPGFCLVPWQHGIGWGVYVPDQSDALRLAAGQHGAELFQHEVVVSTGVLCKLATPRVAKRGHRRLRVDAVTPTCVRASGTLHTAPTAGNVTSTLTQWTAARLGVALERDAVQLILLHRETFPETVLVGGKFGVTRGWLGHIVVETNATGEWLLRCAALIGFGGRTSLGFGRIGVTAC